MIILSPHIDDSVLSLGGLIFEKIKQGEKIKIINVFTKTNYSLLEKKDTEYITKLRKREQWEVQQKINSFEVYLDCLDNCIRNKIDIFELKNSIEKHLNKNEDVYFPLAINNCHKDHKICFDVSIMLNGYNIFYYEDMPYTIKYLDCFPKDRQEVIYEIEIEKKIDILRCYQSQLTNEMLKNIRAYSYSILDGKYYERVWK
jgi:LmbE family N-acetylglucosaminyl deacetylase